METRSVWTYHETFEQIGDEIVGYEVDALDGHIGSVDEASREAGDAHLVVDTGGWIFGKKRLIPAGVVAAIDHDGGRVHLNMTKDQVKSAPDWDSELTVDEWRSTHGGYYSSFTWWPGGTTPVAKG